jgi:hypothetical protein
MILPFAIPPNDSGCRAACPNGAPDAENPVMGLHNRRWWLLSTVLVAACSATPAASGYQSPSAAASADSCGEIDLRDPNGNPLDLNGTWLGVDYGQYLVAQHGSCVSWVGESLEVQPSPAEAAVASNFPVQPWESLFDGQLADDFTIGGSWSEVIPSDHTLNSHADLTVSVEFVEVEGSSQPRLHLPAVDYNNDVWLAPSATVSERRELEGSYAGTECVWVEVDGERYESWAEWLTFTDEIEILGSDHLEILVRPGDRVRVDAQVSPMFGSSVCGSEQTLLLWDIAPAS